MKGIFITALNVGSVSKVIYVLYALSGVVGEAQLACREIKWIKMQKVWNSKALVVPWQAWPNLSTTECAKITRRAPSGFARVLTGFSDFIASYISEDLHWKVSFQLRLVLCKYSSELISSFRVAVYGLPHLHLCRLLNLLEN